VCVVLGQREGVENVVEDVVMVLARKSIPKFVVIDCPRVVLCDQEIKRSRLFNSLYRNLSSS
jgi:hypothetical protein